LARIVKTIKKQKMGGENFAPTQHFWPPSSNSIVADGTPSPSWFLESEPQSFLPATFFGLTPPNISQKKKKLI
jgi:hypothetical protein